MDAMMGIGFLLLEMVNYRLAVKVILGEKVESRTYYYVVLVVYLLYLIMSEATTNASHYVAACGVIYFFSLFYLKGKVSSKILKTIIIMIVFESIDSLLGCLLNITTVSKLFSISEIARYYVRAVFEMIVFLIFSFVIRERQNEEKYLKKRIHIIMALGIVPISFTVTSLNYSQQYLQGTTLWHLNSILIPISYLMVCVMCWTIQSLKRLNDKNVLLLVMETELRDQQKEYYTALLDKEVETRRFRHDINNHIMCIKHLVEQKDLSGTQHYLDKLGTKLSDINNMTFHTGDELFDVILFTKLKSVSATAKIIVSGKMGVPIPMEQMDVCTVFSNLLQNVQEAVKGVEDATIEINIVQNSRKVEITIENSITSPILFNKEGVPITSKENSELHGIGCNNVIDTINKYDGRIVFLNKDGKFRVDIYIPIIEVR